MPKPDVVATVFAGADVEATDLQRDGLPGNDVCLKGLNRLEGHLPGVDPAANPHGSRADTI